MGTLKIELLGTSFSIKASEDDDYLKKLLGYYKNIVDEIQKRNVKIRTSHFNSRRNNALRRALQRKIKKRSFSKTFAQQRKSRKTGFRNDKKT